jgi:tetratricopeptide (TPR) repeat protein
MNHEQEPSIEREIACSREAWGAGDTQDALTHLAVALSLAPLDETALTLLDEILEQTGNDALEVLAVESGTYFGLFALRAFALAKHGHFAEACGLLFDVVSFRPNLPYLAWLGRWIGRGWGREREREEFREAVAARVVSYAKALFSAGTDVLSDGGRHNLEAALAALRWLASDEPPRGRLAFATSYVLRKLGRTTEASRVASDWFAREPLWVSAVEAAAACRGSGDTEAALRYYGEALSRRPSDVSTRLDIGDVLLDDSRYEEAARTYGEVLARAPHHPWAEPSFAFAQYGSTGEARWREELQALALREPTHERAAELEERLAKQTKTLLDADVGDVN